MIMHFPLGFDTYLAKMQVGRLAKYLAIVALGGAPFFALGHLLPRAASSGSRAAGVSCVPQASPVEKGRQIVWISVR